MKAKAMMFLLVVLGVGVVMTAPEARADLLISPSTLSPPCTLPAPGGVTDCGTTSITLPFATISSGPSTGPRNIAIKELAGWYGIGVKGGAVDGEIDMNNNATNPEYIDVLYTGPVTIPEFTIAFLFFPGQYGDLVFETAIATADGALAHGTLTVHNATTALWSSPLGGSSSVINLSPAVNGQAGVWQIKNPFGGTQINSIRFTPQTSIGIDPSTGLPVINPLNNTDSDFAIASVTAVPEPASIALFTTLATAVGLVVRRRSAKA